MRNVKRARLTKANGRAEPDDDACDRTFDVLSPELPAADVARVCFAVEADANQKVRLLVEYSDNGLTWAAGEPSWIPFTISRR